ncbi:MAG: hypothetical protein AAFX40_18180 [Cyanobacteria bacterium J06639_1]
MTPLTIHHFWQFIDRINRRGWAAKQDTELVPLLIDACRQEPPLDSVEVATLNTYINNRLPLIRDVMTSG